MAVIRIEEPTRGKLSDRPDVRAFFSMAFRPFYLCGALFGAVAILAWGFGFQGTCGLPGPLWHGHEMIWGYAGAVIVGFLLTAVATWTGQPPTRGWSLAILLTVWVAARILICVPGLGPAGGLCSVLFFGLAAVFVARPVIASRNARNYAVPVMIVAFGLADAFFLLNAESAQLGAAYRFLRVGLILVASVIFFMGSRVIGFFTSRALKTEQAPVSRTLLLLGVPTGFALAAAVAFGASTFALLMIGAVACAANLIQLARWWRKGVLQNPLLWVLFAGYAMTAIGVGLYGALEHLGGAYTSVAIHFIAVGGIGLLTIGMMTRTALGHTGRMLVQPRSIDHAYRFVLVALVVRTLAAISPMLRPYAIPASAVLLAVALLTFAFRFAPWLMAPRADGKP